MEFDVHIYKEEFLKFTIDQRKLFINYLAETVEFRKYLFTGTKDSKEDIKANIKAYFNFEFFEVNYYKEIPNDIRILNKCVITLADGFAGNYRKMYVILKRKRIAKEI